VGRPQSQVLWGSLPEASTLARQWPSTHHQPHFLGTGGLYWKKKNFAQSPSSWHASCYSLMFFFFSLIKLERVIQKTELETSAFCLDFCLSTQVITSLVIIFP
jgi:hypothetical protein